MNRRIFRIIFSLLIASFIAISITGCEQEGTMEKAGKEIDKAAKDVGEATEKAIQDGGQAVEEAQQKVEKAIEKQKDNKG